MVAYSSAKSVIDSLLINVNIALVKNVSKALLIKSVPVRL